MFPLPPIRGATGGDAGRSCPYCRFALKEGAQLRDCPTCGAAHHDDCWSDNGGCSVIGCTGGPEAPGTGRVSEEDKRRHDPLETGDLQPIRPPSARDHRRRTEPSRGVPGWAIAGFVLLLILAALSLIGRGADDEEPKSEAAPLETTKTTDRPRSQSQRPAPALRTVRLTLAPTADVWVCLETGGGERLIPGTVISPGRPRTFTARRFRLTLGNGSVRLRFNDKAFLPPQGTEPQGYEFSRSGRRTLDEGDRPTCARTP